MESDLLKLVFRLYRRKYIEKEPENVVDVSELKSNGMGARMEPNESRGDRVCFKFAGVLICAATHEKLDLAQDIINSHSDELMEKLDKYERERQIRKSAKKTTKAVPRGGFNLEDLPYVTDVLSKSSKLPKG